MKANIHPKYEEVTIHCACGNEFKTRSTKSDIRLTLCNECHPFFTGKQKFVDTAGRIEKFQKRFNLADGTATADIIKGKKKSLSKKQVQSAAIQEEKRLKAARRTPKAEDGKTAAPPAAADAPAGDATGE